METLIAISRDAPPPVSEVAPGTPAAIDRLVARCLEKRPEARFATCGELLAALEAPPEDVAPPPAAPAPRRPRARRAELVVAAAVLLAAGALAARPYLRAKAPSAATPSAPPPRHPCAKMPTDGSCSAPNVSWCDLEEKPIACCAKGLAAMGEDGLCGCPPGGVTDEPGAPAACPKAPMRPTGEQIKTVVRPHFAEFGSCYDAAVERAS
jgi:serine/threonine-protein kinase